MLVNMKHTANWTDIYGAVHASFQGRSGGHRWVLALPAAQADQLEAVQSSLEVLDAKGRADLLVYTDARAIAAAVNDLGARGVLLLATEANNAAGQASALADISAETRHCAAEHAGTELGRWLDAVPHGR